MRFALVLISWSLLAVVVAPVWATFPGRNGEIAYVDEWGSDVEFNSDLWGVCPYGSREHELGHLDLYAGSATFSANGRWPAAALDYQYDSYGSSIWLIGGKRQERRVTRQLRRGSDDSPVWSPKGGEIAFTRTRSDDDYNVRSRAIRIYGRGHDRFLARGSGPEWSVRDEIAFVRGSPDRIRTQQVYVASVKGGGVRRLAAGYAPDWSPNGRRLVFTYRAEGARGPNYDPVDEIAVISADGTGLRHLASGSQASWSPNGRSIAFVTPRGYAAVISPDRGALRRLGRTSRGASFSPDSQWLAITWEDELYALPVNRGHRHFVTSPESGEELSFLDWGPLPASASSASPFANIANRQSRASCR